jgi:methionyl-tRNA formyltransferase
MSGAVVCAYSLVGRKALEALLECGIDALALYTYSQSAEDKWFEAPAEYAFRMGIPVYMEPNFNSMDVQNRIRELAPDFLFSFYFREMISAEMLHIPKIGAFNLHGSLLPKYRGRAPINWVLVNGETKTGVTLHAMTPKPDDGDIFGQKEIEIAWDETALSLTQKAADAGYDLVRERVPLLVSGAIKGIPQKSLGASSYFSGRKPSDSRLDARMTAAEAFNQIRAVADPWPNAFLDTGVGIIKVPWALPHKHKGHCAPGKFRHSKDGVLLGFADAPLLIAELKNGQERSSDPLVQAEWLKKADIEEE